MAFEEVNQKKTQKWMEIIENKNQKGHKLAHDLGAGSPCLQCKDKCPGLDLHFWRKVCKNCKCNKESHDVQEEDDIYSKFEILFGLSKCNPSQAVLNLKLRFPSDDSIHEDIFIKDNTPTSSSNKKYTFDWIPPNISSELAAEYMQHLPPSKLPISGSDGALYRRQQLEKQVPLHDLNANVCHNLTDEEIKLLSDYLENLKTNAAGQGKIMKLPNLINTENIPSNISLKNSSNSSSSTTSSFPTSFSADSISSIYNTVPKPFKPLSDDTTSNINYDELPPPPKELLEDGNTFSTNLKPPSAFIKPSRTPSPQLYQNQKIQENLSGYNQNTLGTQANLGSNLSSHSNTNQNTFGTQANFGGNNTSSNFGIQSNLTGPNSNQNTYGTQANLKGNQNTFGTQAHFEKNNTNSNPTNFGTQSNLSGPNLNQNNFGTQTNQNSNFNTQQNKDDQSNNEQSNLKVGDIIKNLNNKNNSNSQIQANINKFGGGSGNNNQTGGKINSLSGNSNQFSGQINPTSGNINKFSGKINPSVISGNNNYEPKPTESKINSIKIESFNQLNEKINLPNKMIAKNLDISKGQNMGINNNYGTNIGASNNSGTNNLGFYNNEGTNYPNEISPNYENNLNKNNSVKVTNLDDLVNNFEKMNPNINNKDDVTYYKIPQGKNITLDHHGNEINHVNNLGNHGNLDHHVNEISQVNNSSNHGNFNQYGNQINPNYSENISDHQNNELNKINNLNHHRNKSDHHGNHITQLNNIKKCKQCNLNINNGQMAIYTEKLGENILWHPQCFVCSTCNELLVDLMYFHYKSNVYCLRDYSNMLNIPRCAACDELIFLNEYTLAEDKTYHVKHFCCYECDIELCNQAYIPIKNLFDLTTHPVCITCYNIKYSKKCYTCCQIIHVQDKSIQFNNQYFWHIEGNCFNCQQCKKLLNNEKFIFQYEKPFCSKSCVTSYAALQ